MSHENYVSDYLWPILNTDIAPTVFASFIDYIRRSKVEFDTIACRGTSGLLVAPTVARELGKHLIVSRKESSHSPDQVEGYKNPQRYIIVDDLIASGGTVKAIINHMHRYRPEANCVGVFLYRSIHEVTSGWGIAVPIFNHGVYRLFGVEGEPLPSVRIDCYPPCPAEHRLLA